MVAPKHHPGIREHHGKFQVRYYARDGKEHAKSFRRLSDAVSFQGSLRATHPANRSDPTTGRERLSSCYGRWVDRARATGKPTERTLIGYDEVWRRYIEPAIGGRRLDSLTRADCQAVVDGAPSAWRATDVRKVLSRILSFAVDDECISRNPAARLEVPEIRQEEPRVLTMDEVERLADKIEPRYRALVLLGAYSALRWSELVALTVENVDFMRGRVWVARKIVEAGRLIEGEPKTKRSRRWVTIPAPITLELAEHVRQFPPGDGGLLFTAERGGVIRRSHFRRLVWIPAVKAADLEGFRFRNLRHSGATWSLEDGVSPVLVAFRLGHSGTRMIEKHYGRLVESMDAEIARLLGDSRDADQKRTKSGPRAVEGGTATR
jgi:integrase